ncbi:MAG: SDR family oxidoreductase [bacterium]|nr:SDR family oxidoreductase [bacterium]
MSLTVKTALITGASRGLGYEVARVLARERVNLVLTARGRPALEAAARELRGHTEVVAVCADVGEDAERIVAAGLERFARIDALLNNASELGPTPLPPLARLAWRELERILRVNVLAPLHLAQLVLPGMLAAGGGVIVNVSSDAAVNAYPGWGGYGASKAALDHLSRVLAKELEGTGIRVLAVDPGDMDTQMHRDAAPGEDLSALPKPAAIAPAIVRLLLDQTLPARRYQAAGLLPAR